MPGMYPHTNEWSVAICSGSEDTPDIYDWVKFAAVCCECPTEARNPQYPGRATGYAGGATQEEALTEFRAWMALPSYLSDRQIHLDRGHFYMLYKEPNTFAPISSRNLPYTLTTDEIARNKHMMSVKLSRESGKVYLTVDAAGLHETLDAIGCQTETSGTVTRYRDRPHTTVSVLDTGSHTLSTELLLAKGVQKIDLSAVYTRPPSTENLKKLANSAFEKCRAILDHYQPIDIQVTIQKKVLTGAV